MATASESQPLRCDEFGRLGGIGQAHAADDVFLDAAELAQFGLDHDPLGMGPVHHAAGDLDVLRQRLVRGVDHHRTIKTAVDAIVADVFRAVVQMDGENDLRKDLVGRADHGLQEAFVAIAAGAREICRMNGALTSGRHGSSLVFDLPKFPRNRPTVCSKLLMLYAPTAYLP